jgi:hypothetical protein
MTVAAKPCGFRTHLGNRCAIPTLPPPRRLLDSFNTNQERSFPQPSPQAYFRLILRLEKTGEEAVGSAAVGICGIWRAFKTAPLTGSQLLNRVNAPRRFAHMAITQEFVDRLLDFDCPS